MAERIQVACTNVFKSGDEATLKDQFNLRWIELINRMEKNKRLVPRCFEDKQA